jgi:hypothetical protein
MNMEEAERLAELYTLKWKEAVEKRGRKVTPEGLERVRRNMRLMAEIRFRRRGG